MDVVVVVVVIVVVIQMTSLDQWLVSCGVVVVFCGYGSLSTEGSEE